jgi:cytochrome c-type biogenesis protein CcmH
MSGFLIGFLVLIALALAFVLTPLLRARAADSDQQTPDAREANLQVLREQLAGLDAELAQGKLSVDQHQAGRIEIERRVLEEDAASDAASQPRRATKTAITMGVTIPLLAFVLYGLVGDPESLLPPSARRVAAKPGGEIGAPEIAAMVEKLAQRLETQATSQEGDAQAWIMLARSYAVLQRYADSSRAYERARKVNPESAQLLADHADVIAMTQGQSLAGEPIRLAIRALQLDPNNLKALALAGSAEFERGNFKGALEFWGRAKPLAQAGSDFANGLESSMQQARAALEQAGGTSAAPAMATAANQAAPALGKAASSKAANTLEPSTGKPSGGAPEQVRGRVVLSSALSAKAAPDDTVFIFARAEQGPRMPLAIVKRHVRDLPLEFALDDSTAMSPELRLSKFPKVVVSARISRSGNAMPQPGDLTGQSAPVAPGSRGLVVTVDQIQP